METEPGVPSVFAVNVLAPYVLTVLIERPDRLVYVSSGMHQGVQLRIDDLLLEQACLERLVGICGEQAVRCSARICRRSAVEERPIQRAGAGMGADKDGRLSSSGRSSPGIRNPGVACHERRLVGSIYWRLFLSSTPSCAERDRQRCGDSRGAACRVRPHLGHPVSRLISALRLGERRPGRSRTSPNIIRGSAG